jgi:hypothetical protein
MKLARKPGITSQTVYLFIQDSSSSVGAGLTGLVFNSAGLASSYVRTRGSRAAITLATLGAANSAYSSGGFIEVDATNMPGIYRFDIPDAALASGADSSVIILKGATNMVPIAIEIDLDAQVDAWGWNGTAVAAPNTAGVPLVDLTRIDGQATNGNNATLNLKQLNCVNSAGDAIVASSTGSNGMGLNISGNGSGNGMQSRGGATGTGLTLFGGATSGQGLKIQTVSGDGIGISAAGAGSNGISAVATGGHGINAQAGGASKHGINATGATGGGSSGTCDGFSAVAGTGGVDIRGNITGNITGNVSGSAGSVTGNVGGNVVGSVATVTGNVGGNVVGSVGSVAAGGIASTSFAAGAINAAAIADAAIDRATFAADTGMQTIRSGTCQGSGNTTFAVKLDAGASSTDNYYFGYWIYLTGGTGAGQLRRIAAYNGTTKIVTIDTDPENGLLLTAADGTTTFAILPQDSLSLSDINAFLFNGNGTVTVGGAVTVGTNLDKAGYSLTQSFPPNFASLGISAGGHISNVDTLATYTGNTPQTGDAYPRIGAAGAGLTALGDTRLAHLDADVSSRSTYAGADTAGTTTLLGRFTAARAGYLDNLNVVGVVATHADAVSLSLQIGTPMQAGSTVAATLDATQCNKVADHVHRRHQANVELSIDGDALDKYSQYGAIQQMQHSAIVNGQLVINKTDGTQLGSLAITVANGALPITGVS